MKAPRFWEISPPTPLARLLQPLGALYGGVTAARMARPGWRAGAPVICVGNFVAGGAGKTPAALALARLLIAMGERPAFLSRGYGGSARGAPLAVDPARHDAALVGDEPLLLAALAPCFVCRDRREGAKAAVAAGASVLVADDGLQNPSLAKDLSIALVDGGYGFGNGLCLPAGPLRAPLAAQRPLVSLAILVDADAASASLRAALAPTPCLDARLVPDEKTAARLAGTDVLAFAGIGRPEKFFATLKTLGARVALSRAFPDHHPYTPRELDDLLSHADRLGLVAVTTQKDFVRLPEAYARRTLALPVAMRLADEAAARRALAEALARRRAAN